MSDLRNVTDGWAERVLPEDLGTSPHGAEHLARYLFAAHWVAGASVADLCCGVGYGTNLMRASGATRALGIDINEAAIEEAGQRFGDCEFAVADLTRRFDLSDFPVRVCFEAIEHVPDPHALLGTLAADLPPDGVAFVSTPNGQSGQSDNPHHVREYSNEEFCELLQAHFRSVRIFFQWHYRDPFDAGWTVADVLRTLVPVNLKNRLKRSIGAPTQEQESTVRLGMAADCRPLPGRYLSVLPPGFPRPSIWIAVCS
jgi:2-polyprenyl-3-methyl-5-hydroxy-6-metoxy-1,4-benzoquinol methylase